MRLRDASVMTPTGWLNWIVDGEGWSMVLFELVPTPCKATVSGDGVPVLLTERVAVRTPAAPGVKVT